MKNFFTSISFYDRVIEYGFYALFFFVPLILSPFNYELFEYNKMMLVYALATIIIGAWMAKICLDKKPNFIPTLLDIPIALFFATQVISYFFSMDRHVSFWGYYSRFNGGLLSTIVYIGLYYAFISNMATISPRKENTAKMQSTEQNPLITQKKVVNTLLIAITSGVLVSLYAILERLGIDKTWWVQDVQNRVFSTLGQPNWLAAYVAILLPITLAFLLIKRRHTLKVLVKKTTEKHIVWLWIFSIASMMFYATLLYTKSRSGFLGFWIAALLFWTAISLERMKKTTRLIFLTLGVINLLWSVLFIYLNQYLLFWLINIIGFFIILWLGMPKKSAVFTISTILLWLATFFIRTPFAEINTYTSLEMLTSKMKVVQPVAQQETKPTVPAGTALETGGTESGSIRKIVWKGAVNITKKYPLFGTGVETFAFAYYRYKPVEHNMTSEWDFLYNKAHNEYLNYAATTGILGVGTYLIVVLVFIVWNVWYISSYLLKNRTNTQPVVTATTPVDTSQTFLLVTGLFAGWCSILITNFFGFSVVPINIFFWIIPAISFIIANPSQNNNPTITTSPPNRIQSIAIFLLILLLLLVLNNLRTMWLADKAFAYGYQLARIDRYADSYEPLREAVMLNPGEPLYHDELSYTVALLTLVANEQKQESTAENLEKAAIQESDIAIAISPNNVSFWKTRTRVMYALSQINPKYLDESLKAINKAYELSPTDPKVAYNVALLQAQKGQRDNALATMKAARYLKPDYRDPHYGLALFYYERGEKEAAREELNYILKKINPKDEQAQQKLKEWGY